MRTLAILLITLCLALPARPADETPNPWDRALGAVGLTRATCQFDFLDMANMGGDEFLLPYFHAMHADPLRIPFYSRILRESVLANAQSGSMLVMLGGARISEGTRLTLLGDPLKPDADQVTGAAPLSAAIEAACVAGGQKLPPARLAALAASAKQVPADVARAAALVVRTEIRALDWRKRALAGYRGDLATLFGRLAAVNPDVDDVPLDPALSDLMHHVDLKYLLVGGELVTLAADKAADDLAKRTGSERFTFDFDTPLGRVSLHGAQDDTYAGDRAMLLSIDTGGNDTYGGGGATFDALHPASVLVDLAGNDRYIAAPGLAKTAVAAYGARKKGTAHPTFGAGVLGYGALVDASGDDLYRSLNTTQGRAAFGVGLLEDRGGSDQYDCYMLGQGSATFGVGVLADAAGSDQYRCFTTSQGFGDTKGYGLLVHAGAGNDLYEANDTVIDFPASQTKEHNASLAQGAGFGRRADYIDGHSLAGGVGALVDGGGRNSFTGGLFCQGAGYWYGAGILSAGGGDDTYRGVWYVQGSAAHFAIGILDDLAGNDTHVATMNMAEGAGHDYSIGFLIDRDGNDRYEAPNLSLGGGNANGIGIFWDRQGDDTYQVSPSTTLGRASIESTGTGSIRERDLTLGYFLDTGGRDTYPANLPWAANGALWTMAQSGAPQLPVMRGVGLDVEAPATTEP